MRWDNLFDDLESQLEHELTAGDIDVRAEEERLRLARMSLRERLVSIHEHSSDAAASDGIRVRLADGRVVTVRPFTFGKDWFSAALVDGASRHSQCIVPVVAVAGLLL